MAASIPVACTHGEWRSDSELAENVRFVRALPEGEQQLLQGAGSVHAPVILLTADGGGALEITLRFQGAVQIQQLQARWLCVCTWFCAHRCASPLAQ